MDHKKDESARIKTDDSVMVEFKYTDDELWDRIERAHQKVRTRLDRTSAALNQAGIPYAVIGGFAVQVWVSQVDEGAIRNTRDVDILLRRSDLSVAIQCLTACGFHFNNDLDKPIFLDAPNASAWDAVHIFFANEKVRENNLTLLPDVDETICERGLQTIKLPALVRMQLTAWRLKDKVHLHDMQNVGLIDQTWIDRVPVELQPRLQEILDNPDG